MTERNIAVSPSGKADDSDSSIARVQILPPQPNITKRLHSPKGRCNLFVIYKDIFIRHGAVPVGAITAMWLYTIVSLLRYSFNFDAVVLRGRGQRESALVNRGGTVYRLRRSRYASNLAWAQFQHVSLDDLSGVLPLDKTKDPTLEVDTDPSIVIPTDAVTVTDVPGEADQTLTQLKTNTRLDIDIPSLIASKFPFCIPFDLIRIMSVLGADPVAPVFRIPISTDMKNLEPFAGNQTIGEIPEDFEPMFEIDEELVIDLSCIPLVQPICYTVFIISFVVLLIYITPKMINH